MVGLIVLLVSVSIVHCIGPGAMAGSAGGWCIGLLSEERMVWMMRTSFHFSCCEILRSRIHKLKNSQALVGATTAIARLSPLLVLGMIRLLWLLYSACHTIIKTDTLKCKL